MLDFLTNKRQSTVKESVIETLAEEFPLSINQLKSKIFRSHGLKVSYQAVHKEIVNLESIGIVTKEKNTYVLNTDWLKRCSAFFSQTELNYSRVRRYSLSLIKKVQNEGDMVSLEFSSITELDEYFVNVMDNFEHLAPEQTPIIMHYRHNWYPIIYAKKEGEILAKDATKSRFYCLCGSNTTFDKWAIGYENAIGMQVTYKSGAAEKWDLQVYGDVIIQFHLDPSVAKNIDNFFKKNSNILNYNPKELIDILHQKGRFSVIIYRNALLAEQLRKETLEAFK